MKLLRLFTAGVLVLFGSTSMASTVFVPTGDSVDFEFFFPPFSLEDPELFIFDAADTGFTDGLFVPVTNPLETASVEVVATFVSRVGHDGRFRVCFTCLKGLLGLVGQL